VRTCTLCKASSPDPAPHCVQCGADLSQVSETAVALAEMKASPRVHRVRLLAANDACPACLAAEGEFAKDRIPELPTHGCSHAHGCRCFYAPALTELYP